MGITGPLWATPIADAIRPHLPENKEETECQEGLISFETFYSEENITKAEGPFPVMMCRSPNGSIMLQSPQGTQAIYFSPQELQMQSQPSTGLNGTKSAFLN